AGQGLVTVDVASAVAKDAANNDNTAATQFSITFDTLAPTLILSSSTSSPTSTSPIPVTATFSEDVTGFVVGDITVGNGAAGNFVPVSGTVYTFDVTPAGQGLVTVDVASAVAKDAANNDNTAATQFSITFN
ncbi:MAG TPA: Ig-like domain-containing protein, partial [Nitrosopumilaceae archaeon]|nr:Ig-like domain-containing protein [Nitrosopumilaceae archaeon]